MRERKLVKQLWFWVIIAIALGIVFGLLFPGPAESSKWLADAFIQMIKTVTGPVIFLTVVIGIASLGNLARAGGLALRALAYFFGMTVVALTLGLVAANVFAPGSGFEGEPSESARESARESIDEAGASEEGGLVGFITDDLLPTSFVSPFVENEILRILVLAILVAAAISMLADKQSKQISGMVLPTGYSFNLDGTCIYLTLGALFIVQATGQDMAIGEQIALAGLMVLTSKGAAGITGAGLVTLTASLQAFGGTFFSAESIAVGIALVVGIDRIMSEGRALTNCIGNSVATMVIARWQGELDEKRFHAALDDPSLVDPDLVPEEP